MIAAILAAGFVGSLADWLFGGVLWHEKYMAYPEIWRNTQDKSSENKAVLWATVLDFFTAGVFVTLSAWLNLYGWSLFLLAAAIWLVAPLPQLIVQALFIKLHPLITVSHALGWLARLMVAATAMALICGS